VRYTAGPRGGITRRRKGRCRPDHCRRVGPIYKNGLTLFCVLKLRAAGRLHEFPPTRQHHRNDELLDEWRDLAASPPLGTTHADIAHRMGVTKAALARALARARRDGDPRAIYLPHALTGERYRESVVPRERSLRS
jgi:CRP-like cAMP-binding protein